MEARVEKSLSSKNYFYWVTWLLAFGMLGCYIIVGLMVFHYGSYEKRIGWSYALKEDFYFISKVLPDSPANGKLQVGDKILSINKDTSVEKNFFTIDQITQAKRKIPANGTYKMEIERNGVKQEVTLSSTLTNNYKKLWIIASFILASLAFSISGLLIGLLKPDQTLTRRLTLSMFATACYMLLNGTRLMNHLIEGFYYPFYLMLWASYPIVFPLAYDVYSNFPANLTKSKFWTLAKQFLYLYAALILVIWGWRDFYRLKGFSNLPYPFDSELLLFAADKAFDLLIISTLILLVGVITNNYRLIKDLDQKRRIKWVVYGSVVGLLPTLINNVTTLLLNTSDDYRYIITTNGYFLFTRFGEFFITIIPVSFVYVIVKHQVFEVNFVVRQGLQYLLAKNVLRGILAIEIIGVIAVAILKPELTVGQILSPKSGYLYLLLVTIASFVYRSEITDKLDKIFFREAYNRELVLGKLLNKIKELDSISTISELISSKIAMVIHPKSMYFFYRDLEKTHFTLEHSLGSPTNTKVVLVGSELMKVMQGEQVAKELDFLAPIPDTEKLWLIEMKVQLIVPMIGRDKDLVGLLLLGEKHSEEPYSGRDKKLLEDIASQLGIIYENNLLKKKVDKEEKIKHEVLSRLEDQNINLVRECPKCGKCFDSSIETCDQDNSELTLTLPVERIIDGKYRLDKLLGKGGMGAVYAATDLRLERIVAVKILKGNLFGDQEAVRRFEREAKASAKMAHPNIVAIHDYGKLMAEGAYLVMELVNGVSLKTKLLENKTLAPSVVADLFNQILDGMKLAHGFGIIHRDLKPDNILLTEVSGRMMAKILDFGIAKIKPTDTVDPNSLTVPGTIIGTFGYMPPEQFSGEEIDERVDIFALGVMIVESLTGNKPFVGKTLYELMGAMVKRPYHLPGNSLEVKKLDEKIQKCLAKEPKDRFSSISEMQQEIIPAIYNCLDTAFTAPVKLSSSESDTIKINKTN